MSIVEIGNYQFSTQDQIGKGYSSVVYRGIDKSTRFPVVFKVIDTSKKTQVEQLLLNNELKALQMMDHPYVLETFTIKKSGNSIFIVCESCEGDLATDIRQSGSYTENQALDTLTFLAYGVNYIHSLGILHRDLKPSNVLLKGDGTIRIADFGFCEFYRQRSQGPTRYNVGSPLYMSPQAYNTTTYSVKSDCWALGVIFYEMLLGQTPFKGMNYGILIQNIQNGYIIGNLPISDYSKQILYKLLNTDAQKRWSTDELLQVLKKRTAQYDYTYQSGYPVKSSFVEDRSSKSCCC